MTEQEIVRRLTEAVKDPAFLERLRGESQEACRLREARERAERAEWWRRVKDEEITI